ncbi:hypothetical protein [Psychromicrobium sp. YIM B11713]|uniref:hypothetical protein n=1 Tax=Psychromicrobium sp. YIM B11713 TaxID=3145233 RepID=UPI00374E22B5
MKNTAQLAEEAAAKILAKNVFQHEEGEAAIQAVALVINGRLLGYEDGFVALVDQAIQLDRAQRPSTLVNDERDLEVGIWTAHPDMAADGGPEAIVVQIDTDHSTNRLRINVNDAPVWDGNPQTDEAPGRYFDIE